MIYLCSPYAHPDPDVRQERAQQVCAITGALIRAGLNVFSPIVYSVQMSKYVGDDWNAWRRFALAMLDRCDELWIATLPGWLSSQGTAQEVVAWLRARPRRPAPEILDARSFLHDLACRHETRMLSPYDLKRFERLAQAARATR